MAFFNNGKTVAPWLSGAHVERRAVISDCGLYRYALSRRWGDGPLMAFIMLNPSTADGNQDDPTIRRCMRFAFREKADGILVVNLCAYRATEPKQLRKAANPHGSPQNMAFIDRVLRDAATPVVCAWGNHGAVYYTPFIAQIMRNSGAGFVCFGKTDSSHPKHPLYVPNDKAFESFMP